MDPGLNLGSFFLILFLFFNNNKTDVMCYIKIKVKFVGMVN